MADDDAPVTGSEGASSFDEFPFPGGQDLGANQAGVTHPATQRECQDEIENAWTAEGDKGDRQQYSGKREKGVHHHDIHETVDASAVVAGDRTDYQPQKKGSGDNARAHQHGNARAEDEAGKDVATEFVGAAPVRG